MHNGGFLFGEMLPKWSELPPLGGKVHFVRGGVMHPYCVKPCE
jgi:hypothetical protein